MTVAAAHCKLLNCHAGSPITPRHLRFPPYPRPARRAHSASGQSDTEIEIWRYITLGSLDAYRWRTLTTKAGFIAQLRAGARGVRTAEDIDSPLPEAAMIKAAATGDPRIMEHAELTREVR